MNTLACHALSKSFDGVHALQDVRLSFPESGIVAIVGPNGAGKTTFLDVVTGFLHPNGGNVTLNGRDISHLQPHQIARLGIARTFQELRLISQLSVLENVLLARRCQKGERLFPALFRNGVASEESQNRSEAIRWLKFIGIADKAEAWAGKLSYGQQKLLTLACCLATDARILLLDEPVAGLHPQMIEQILNVLRQMRDLGKLVIFIEHDLTSVRIAADLVVVMDEGKIIAQGKPDSVLGLPEIMDAFVN